jgi:hypothetical protein
MRYPTRYPDAFVAQVQTAFPNAATLHDALRKGLEVVGRYLCDSRGQFTGEEVARALAGDGSVVRRAHLAAEAERLYRRWLELDREG